MGDGRAGGLSVTEDTSYIITDFMLASRHPGLEIKTLDYYTLYRPVR